MFDVWVFTRKISHHGRMDIQEKDGPWTGGERLGSGEPGEPAPQRFALEADSNLGLERPVAAFGIDVAKVLGSVHGKIRVV